MTDDQDVDPVTAAALADARLLADTAEQMLTLMRDACLAVAAGRMQIGPVEAIRLARKFDATLALARKARELTAVAPGAGLVSGPSWVM